MAEEKKDLTGLAQYAAALEKAGQAPPAVEGAVMEEIPIEKIDNFESLEEYAIANPPAEVQELQMPDISKHMELSIGAESLESESGGDLNSLNIGGDSSGSEGLPELNQSDFNTTDFPVSSSSEGGDAANILADHLNHSDLAIPSEEGSPNFEQKSGLTTFTMPETAQEAVSPEALSSENVDQFSELDSNLNPSSEVNNESPLPAPPSAPPIVQATPSVPSTPPPAAPIPPTKPAASLEQVKKFSEKVSVGKPAVPAAFPFSLLINGRLSPEEKEKLLDLLSRENMGIREIDLEPQFASHRILIPRISEFAGILLIQALRGTRAKLKLGPSDTIFSTQDTRTKETESLEMIYENADTQSIEIFHPAEILPITSDNHLPGSSNLQIIDTITASAALKVSAIEVERSSEYQDLIEALQRELKYKAYRRGAEAIILFKIQMTTLSSPSNYRVVLMGTAVRNRKPGEKEPNSTVLPKEDQFSENHLTQEILDDDTLGLDLKELDLS